MISNAEYARRRKKLMRRIGPDAVALIPSAPSRVQSRDVHWPYRQDSDFLYLTGFPEPEAVAMLLPGHPDGEFVMFCKPRNPASEQWEGTIAGPKGACEHYGADAAYPIEELDEMILNLLRKRQTLCYALGQDGEFDGQVARWIDQLRLRSRAGHNPPEECRLLDRDLHEMRLFKSRSEIALMRRASAIVTDAHRRAMATAKPGCHEYELEAELLYETQRHDMRFAYSSIVASGHNACTLHYSENSRRTEEGDLVLIDSGGMFAGYASDITRTWPVSGQFTPAQREIYELVLEAQQAAIRRCAPGNTWDDLHRAATRVLTRGLVHLGVLKGRWQTLWKEEAYKPFFMHGTSHWLGMDVHDVGEYRVNEKWRTLEPGMVTTVEPGLYFMPGLRGVPKRFRGIGVRIEDDVAVTRNGPDVLSASLPADPDEICRLVGATAR